MPISGAAQGTPVVDDLLVGYSFMHITSARVGDRSVSPKFNRQNLRLEIGSGDFAFGTIVQRATPSPSTTIGIPETAAMLTISYARPVRDWLQLEALVRVAISEGVDEGQPLYGADTDVRLKLVVFEPVGWGPLDGAWFPSIYAGVIVNRFGRTQLIAGAGTWWRGFGGYVTGLYSLNGVRDPMMPGSRSSSAFAAANNANLTLSISYDLDISSRNRVRFEVRRNIPIRNSGNDSVGVVEVRHFFD